MLNQQAQSAILTSYISSTSGSLLCVSNPSTTVALIAVATCKARMLSFCNRHRILPEDVRLLFGGFSPSMGHGKRICSILKSEWSRQARLYRIHLEGQLHSSLGAEQAQRAFRHFSHLANQTTESLWQCTLSQLRAHHRPKVKSVQVNRIYTEGNVTLPEDISKGLALGPKFAVQPRTSGPELLSLVHKVSGLAPASEMDRCVSSGVDVLLRDQREPRRPIVRRLASYLKTNSYCVLPSDKEGGFAVFPRDLYKVKALEALSSVFHCRENVQINKLKSEAKKLCESMNLSKLVRDVANSKSGTLEVFFSAKTHKEGCPLRAIVSERNTWQKCLAVFLLDKFRLLTVDDPYRVKDSSEVVNFLAGQVGVALDAFSIDLKDLYYSMPKNALLQCVQDSIDQYGPLSFQNDAGIPEGKFMALLELYLRSTYVEWDGSLYLQKSGVCIGSCLAPFLSDLFLARAGRTISSLLEGSGVIRVFRFVDDFLVLIDKKFMDTDQVVTNTLTIFRHVLSPLIVTHELSVDSTIRFLDLRLFVTTDHTCWQYEPRANKPLLPFSSSHSKLVKRSIANMCLLNAFKKSCPHRAADSFLKQVDRLEQAGYPQHTLVSVAEKILKKSRNCHTSEGSPQDNVKLAVIPYVHRVSHNLKKIAEQVDVKVVFSAPLKLSRLCKMTNPFLRKAPACNVNHQNKYVICQKGVVYEFPCSCGRWYVGHTEQCLNDRLRQHNNNVRNGREGHLAIHCRDCHCVPNFSACAVVARSPDKSVRLIIEAKRIIELGDLCVSVASISLSPKELRYLNAAAH